MLKIISFFLLACLFTSTPSFALDDSVQLKLERAGRLLASTYIHGIHGENLFGFHPDYSPNKLKDLIDSDTQISITTKHSIREEKEPLTLITGYNDFNKWLKDVRDNFRSRENLNARTMGTCIKGCCDYPLDGGISHNSLYLTEACFIIKNKTPYLWSVRLYDGD